MTTDPTGFVPAGAPFYLVLATTDPSQAPQTDPTGFVPSGRPLYLRLPPSEDDAPAR